MTTRFYELRKVTASGGQTTDIMRHLHTRQYLGKTIVICQQATATLSAARKQWLKLGRHVQKLRASTLDADKILKYTHTVTHMQHVRFSSKTPYNEPAADIYFLEPEALETLPIHCFTMYLTTVVPTAKLAALIDQLPPSALVVDYTQNAPWQELGLTPKARLEEQAATEWEHMQQFLATYRIDARELTSGLTDNAEAMEEALDILLGASRKFLQIANDFQHALELARPLRLSKAVREQYDAAILLAHRVQALSPNAFTHQFLETYNEDDTFFLHDSVYNLLLASGESLAEAIARHLQANRLHLAQALKHHYSSPVGSARHGRIFALQA